MQIRQLRKVLEAFAHFGTAVCGRGGADDLRHFASVFPAESKETAAKFVARVKKNLVAGNQAGCPRHLEVQLKTLAAALSSAGAKANEDIGKLLSLLEGLPITDMNTFISHIIAARDFVPPPKPPKLDGGKKVDAVVERYVDQLRRAAIEPQEFSAVFNKLKADVKLSDTRVKKISKALRGEPAKSREEAFANILTFQNRQALSHSSTKALDLTSV